MSEKDKHDQLEKLRWKAELLRNAHSMLHRKFKRYSNWLHFFILVGSSIVAILTFAGYETFLPLFPSWRDAGFKLGVGLFASLVFILTVIEEYLKLGSKVGAHENAIKQLTTFIREIEIVQKLSVITNEDMSKLVKQYTSINESIPTIPDNVFFKAKQGLKRKIEISKALDNHSFLPITLYKWYKIFEGLFDVKIDTKKVKEEDKHFVEDKDQQNGLDTSKVNKTKGEQ